MKSLLAATAMAVIAMMGFSGGAQAIGCASGAAAGGVAGHMAGHHALLGAAAGCAVGHHVNAKQKQNASAPAGGASATQPQ